MKRLYILSLVISLTAVSWAQNFGTLTIHKTSQNKETYNIEDVRYMRYMPDGQQQLFLTTDYETATSILHVDSIKSITFQWNQDFLIDNILKGYDNSHWFDYQRMLMATEMMAGNFYQGSSPFMKLAATADNQELTGAASSLNGRGGNVSKPHYVCYPDEALSQIEKLTDVPDSKGMTAKGEIMLWEALAMFYQVRLFGAVPLTCDPAGVVSDYANMKDKRIAVSSLYNYIIKTLEKAITLLPEHGARLGDLDQYCAKALLAKVYLTRAGFDEQHTRYVGYRVFSTPHERNAEDLQKAAQLALDVIQNSGRSLMTNYSDIFKGRNNRNSEALISWRWEASQSWTRQSFLQCDLAPSGFGDFNDCWGDWTGVSLDLQQAFGEDVNSTTRTSKDARRKATMMMMGDKYDYFYTEFGGFDLNTFLDNGYEGHLSRGMNSPTKAYCAKHLYGTVYDHEQAGMGNAGQMCNGLYTHVLRLADVYLIYCEAIMGNNSTTTDATALDCFYQVRHRGLSDYQRPTSISWEDVWKERRLEMALEGDRWFDFVRLYYYDPSRAISELSSLNRNAVNGVEIKAVVTDSSFTMPYPVNSELARAAAYSPRLADIEGFAPQPANPVTITSVSPQPARFGEPLVLSGTNLDRVSYVTIPNVGKISLPSADITTTATTLTISNLPEKTQPGELELGVEGFQWPVFVTITVIEPTITSITPNPVNAGEQLTITGTNLELVNSIAITCFEEETGDMVTNFIREFTRHSTSEIVFTVPDLVQEWFNSMTIYMANGTSMSVPISFKQTTKIIVFKASESLIVGNEGSIGGLNMNRVKHLYIGNTEVQFQLIDESHITFTVPEMEPGNYHYVFEAEDGSRTTGPAITVKEKGAEIEVNTAIYTDDGQATFPFQLDWSRSLYLRRNCQPAIEQLELTAGQSRLVIYKQKESTGVVLVYVGDWTYSVSVDDWEGNQETLEIVLSDNLINFIKGTATNGINDNALILQGQGVIVNRIAIRP